MLSETVVKISKEKPQILFFRHILTFSAIPTTYYNLRQPTTNSKNKTTYDMLRQPKTCYDNLRHATTTYDILRQQKMSKHVRKTEFEVFPWKFLRQFPTTNNRLIQTITMTVTVLASLRLSVLQVIIIITTYKTLPCFVTLHRRRTMIV